MTRVAILQSNYIPWKGYFDIIHDVDVFVFHDNIRYTKGDWRNRNRIKTAAGERWLTIPVGTNQHRRICDVALPEGWAECHWRQIAETYRRAPYFAMYRPYFEWLYRDRHYASLSALNQALIVGISRDLLGMRTAFRNASEFALKQTGAMRVIELAILTGADVYVSGPSGRAYLQEEAFTELGIQIEWKDYRGYPVHPQFHPPFSHAVTILDLLFHTGRNAAWFIWGWRERARAVGAA